jgi:hypothetical protein
MACLSRRGGGNAVKEDAIEKAVWKRVERLHHVVWSLSTT